MSSPKIYLTFDLEEFDIPKEFEVDISWQEQISITENGLKNLLTVLEKHNVTATFFTTAAFAHERPEIIKKLSERYEIASHSYWHSSFSNKDLKDSLELLQKITGQKVHGLRMPRMRQVDVDMIKKAGYNYDSSFNPTLLPGRYNFTHIPRTGFIQEELLRIPTSVATWFRIPLFWLLFKNLPFAIYKTLANVTLKKDGYLNLYFHPWEFTELDKYKLPGYVKKLAGQPLLNRLDNLIDHLKPKATFDQLKNFERKNVVVFEAV